MSISRLRLSALVAVGTALCLSFSVQAATKWTRLAPQGEGFSIDMPGTPTANSKPGGYVYEADDGAFFVTIRPVSDILRDSVTAADRALITQYLDNIHKGMVRDKTERSSSTADFSGYPSVRFSADGESDDKQVFQATYWFIVTELHEYMLMAIGPRGAPTATADRFMKSFRLVGQTAKRSGSAARPTPKTTSKEDLAPLAQPILAVAYMISEERLRAEIDDRVKKAPAGSSLGNQWSEAHPAWEKARGSLAVRLIRIVESYQSEGELTRQFDDAYSRLVSASQADALAAALNGPAGGEIMREEAMLEFISLVMADDPNGPKVGDRAWTDKTRALRKTFDDGVGSVLPRDAAREADATKFFATPTGELFRRFFGSVVNKAATQIVGAARVVFFDQRDAINGEIESAIAAAR